MSKEIIFIGGVGALNEYVGGELTKNKNLLSALKKAGRKVYLIDTHNARRKLWKLLPIPLVLLLHPRTSVILSTHIGNVYWLIRFFSLVKTKRKVIFIGTGGAFSKWILEGKFKAKYFKCLHKIVVQGKKMLDELTKAGLNQGYLLPNSKVIDYIPYIVESEEKERKVRFVFMSRMQEEKGIEMILDSAKQLNQNGFQNCYTIDYYGLFEDDSYKKRFISKLQEVPNAQFNGVLNLRSNQGYDELATYDVMLFPSYWKGEGFPGIVIDALIAGLPIVISDWNFNADYIEEGVTGYVIKAKDAQALYCKMVDCIVNKDKYIKQRSVCQSRAKQFDTNKIVNEHLFVELGI